MCVLWNVQMDKTIDSIDTSRTVVIPGSRLGTVWKLIWSAIGLLVAGGLVTLLMTLLLTAQPSSGGPDYFFMAIGYLFVFLFALMVIACIGNIYLCRKFLKISDNVLTISPDGVRDRRVLDEFVPWQAVKSVRTAEHAPDYYLAPQGPGRVMPVRRAMMDVVFDLDPALISQAFKTHARVAGIVGASGDLAPIKDTRPWMTFTIDLWRLKNITASGLYDICEAYANAAQRKRAA
jgi:hypothetical protein